MNGNLQIGNREDIEDIEDVKVELTCNNKGEVSEIRYPILK